MVGEVGDFVSRLRRVLPTRWFGGVAPQADALLSGFGTAWSAIYALIAVVRNQARLLTASGVFIDMIAQDFFGGLLPRRATELDAAYAQRIRLELLRPRGTRQAMTLALTQLTGQPAVVFEPARPTDTGGYNTPRLSYRVAGALGSLGLPYQSFIKVRRPHGAGIALFAGYGTGGYSVYGALGMVVSAVPDTDIYATAAGVVPAGYTAWVQILP